MRLNHDPDEASREEWQAIWEEEVEMAVEVSRKCWCQMTAEEMRLLKNYHDHPYFQELKNGQLHCPDWIDSSVPDEF